MGALPEIGGNLADIKNISAKLNLAAVESLTTTGKTRKHAEALQTEVAASMVQLKKAFNETAAELTALITDSHKAFEESVWTGRSQEAADLVRVELSDSVNSIVEQVNGDFDQEKDDFNIRINSLIDQIETNFGNVMTEVNERYSNLGAAASQTADNLSLADDTIKLGG